MDSDRLPATAGALAWTDAQRAHLILRVTLGLNIATHGLARIGHPAAFADALVRDFQTTWLPAWSVRAFALPLPFLELAVGLAVLIGLRTRAALAVGGAMIAALTFGACLRESWEIAGLQVVYALAYYVLAARAGDLRFAVERP